MLLPALREEVCALHAQLPLNNLVAWTSWISDLIPSSLRGRYFGRRNFICNALGAVTDVAAGQFVQQVGCPARQALPLPKDRIAIET